MDFQWNLRYFYFSRLFQENFKRIKTFSIDRTRLFTKLSLFLQFILPNPLKPHFIPSLTFDNQFSLIPVDGTARAVRQKIQLGTAWRKSISVGSLRNRWNAYCTYVCWWRWRRDAVAVHQKFLKVSLRRMRRQLVSSVSEAWGRMAVDCGQGKEKGNF